MMESGSRQDKIKTAFLATLTETGNVTAAAKASGVGRSTAYAWRLADEDFAAQWDSALAEATDRLAYEARRRALEGIEDVRYFKGEPVGTVRRYSDQLLMFLLRAYRPDVYRRGAMRPAPSAATLEKARDDLSRKMENLAAGNDTPAAPTTDQESDTGGD